MCYSNNQMRKIKFANNEYYHVYNRGTDKRNIFLDSQDIARFIIGIKLSNSIDNNYKRVRDYFDPIPIVSPDSIDIINREVSDSKPLIEIYAYNFLPNHYHFVLRQCVDGGISLFINRVQSGYTKYFNSKHERSGSLMQGPFKASHLASETKLKMLIGYVTNNQEIHNFDKKYLARWSSKNEYLNNCSVLFDYKDKTNLFDDDYEHRKSFDEISKLILEQRE